MEIPVYLAMTAAEFRSCGSLPPHTAWLSCTFSPYGQGLSNIPKWLPPNSLLILSDQTPISEHDPELVFHTLRKTLGDLSCSGLLLDFERPIYQEAQEIAKKLSTLPYPVAVAAPYAEGLDCPVFLPSPPPSRHLEAHLAPWRGREIWLEISPQAQTITITKSGATFHNRSAPSALPNVDKELFCHYGLDIQENAAIFTLNRTLADFTELLSSTAHNLPTRAIGLYQELAAVCDS